MKILIKSVEEIEKTLDYNNKRDGVFHDKCGMKQYSGKVLDTKGEKSSHGYHRASNWTWHPDWIYVLPDEYEYEKFESLEDAVLWVADKGLILSKRGSIVHDNWNASFLVKKWKSWHKAIPVKPKTLQIVRYINVYDDGSCGEFYDTEKASDIASIKGRIDCKRIEFNYEFRNGRWVEAWKSYSESWSGNIESGRLVRM